MRDRLPSSVLNPCCFQLFTFTEAKIGGWGLGDRGSNRPIAAKRGGATITGGLTWITPVHVAAKLGTEGGTAVTGAENVNCSESASEQTLSPSAAASTHTCTHGRHADLAIVGIIGMGCGPATRWGGYRWRAINGG